MQSEDRLKDIVRQKYTAIAIQDKTVNSASCCGATDPSKEVYNIMTDDYSEAEGYVEEADLGLGCGLPLEYARLSKGDIVVDLGSGAGNDCFIARHEIGLSGKVIGIDFTPAMIKKARTNAHRLGYNNVEFRLGDIDDMPVDDSIVDVVVSNCVLNLVPNKAKVVDEIARVLKPGGHFSISDVVLVGQLPESILKDAEMYAGCVSGAIQKENYLNIIREAGFINIRIQKEKVIVIPDDILSKTMSTQEIETFKSSETGIYSITVYGEKPNDGQNSNLFNLSKLIADSTSCTPGGDCC